MPSMLATALHRVRRSSITVRMVLLVVLVVGGTTATIGALSYVRARDALEAAGRARLELLARDMARNLHGELAERVADITTWARLEAMLALTFSDVDKELAEFLRHALAGRPAYRALAGFDVEGERVASAGDAVAVPLRSLLAPSTRLRVAPHGDADAAELVVETPVFNPRKPAEPIGMLAGVLASGQLLDAMAVGRDPAAPAVEITVLASDTGIILRGETDARLRTDGEPAMLEETARLPNLQGVESPALTVVVREPAAVALANVLSLRRTLVWIGLLVLLLSGAVGGAVAWRISQPIRRLTASVKEITARGRPEPIADFPEAAGEVGILSSAFQDMLERLTAAQREAIMQSRLALLGEVAASIAHDVRTPLSVLKTSAQLLAGAEVPAPEQRDLARMVAAEVDRLNGVVSNLVDLARPRPVRIAPESVQALVESAVAVLRPWARSADVVIEMDARATELRVRADRDQVQQVLLNLIHNAVQAASKPGRVAVRSYPDAPWAVIEVTDTGAGFTPEALERAFSPFFTTKPEGTGLGLAIAKRIVEEQGGEVGARNLEGGGASVWIRLPMVMEVT
jgi:two-component system sensor histidine kinase HydH